jgi:hypothetical protein
MNPQAGLLYLAEMLHGQFFNSSAFLVSNNTLLVDLLQTLRLASIALFVMFFLLEINRRLIAQVSGQPLNLLPLVIGSSLLGFGISSPSAYLYICKIIISLGDLVSKSIDNINTQAVGLEIQNLMRGPLQGSLNPVSLFMAIIDMLNPLTAVTVILYWVATGLLFVMPILQAIFLALFILLGPILIPMSVFKPFSGLGSVWLFSMLAASFFSVFGIIAYTAISVSGILTFIAEAQSNVFISATYSLVTILVILSIPKISFNLFRGSYASLTKGASMTLRLLRVF